MKTCIRCHEIKQDEDFALHGRGRRDKFCRACLNAARREKYATNPEWALHVKLRSHQYRQEHPEHVAAKKRQWSVANRAKLNQATRESAARRPEKIAAIQAVRKAIRLGLLARSPCEVCGEPDAEAHHDRGYEPEHWLDVTWLCESHHRDQHRKYPKELRLQPSEEWRSRHRLTDEELLERLRTMARDLGRAPRVEEVHNGVYERRFGSWRNAKRMAGL